MALKITTSETGPPNVLFEKETNPIREFFQGLGATKRAEAAEKRAEADQIMKQAQHDYQMKTIAKTENSANAMAEWSSKGLPYDKLTTNPISAFGTPIPNAMENFRGYKDAMAGYGITAEARTFSTAVKADQQQYMNDVMSQFNAVASRLRAENPGASPENINRVLKENYSADMVYQNMLRAGLEPMEAGLDYDPTQVKRDLLPRVGEFFWEPPVEDIGGGLKIQTPATIAGAYAVGKGSMDVRAGYKDLLAQAKKDWGDTSKNSAGKFKAKYNMTKTQAGGSPGKNKVFTSSKELKKVALSKGYGNIKVPGLKAGKAALPYAAGAWAGAKGASSIAEAMGGGEGAQLAAGAAGGAAGIAGTKLTMTKVAKKLADPAVMKRILPILKKRAPSLAAKIAVSTTGLVVPEGVSTALGAAGLLWGAYDLIQLANSVPEIYELLAGD